VSRTARALAALLAVATAPAFAQAPAPVPQTPPAKAEPEPGWRVEPFALRNDAADFRLRLTGYVQADFRSYEDWTVAEEALRADEAEWRRLRLGLDGRWRRLAFEVDFAAAFDADDELKDAWAELRLTRWLSVRGGHHKVPVSPEWLTSPSKQDFVERAAAVEAFAPGRDWGVSVLGEIGRAVEYQAGVFQGDGSKQRTRAGRTFAGRLVLKPWKWLELAGSTSQADVAAVPAGPELDPAPKGFSAASLTAYRFFEPVFVDGRRQRWGGELLARGGPVSLRGEYLEEREERRGQGPTLEDLPDVVGRGFQVAATWLVTGERKVRTIRPDRPLLRGPGAIEIGVRYEEMHVDDVEDEGFEGFGNRARNVRPAGFRALTGGVSWWPTTFLRLAGDVLVERYTDALRAPEPGREGNYVTLVGRAQVHIP
jgi:phosphate-selective porin